MFLLCRSKPTFLVSRSASVYKKADGLLEVTGLMPLRLSAACTSADLLVGVDAPVIVLDACLPEAARNMLPRGFNFRFGCKGLSFEFSIVLS